MKYRNILYLDNAETIYTWGIKNELRNLAGNVDCYFYDDIYKPPIFYRQLHPKKNKKIQSDKIDEFLEYIRNEKYDIILVKHPVNMPISFFRRLSKFFKAIPIINYNWSSVKKFNYLPYREFFTKVYSFDPEDCKKYKVDYYPLFYLKDFEKIARNMQNKRLYDISFIGTGYSPGRLEFLNKLIHKEDFKKLTHFIYIFTPGKWKSLKVKTKYRKLSNYFFWHHLSLNAVCNVFSFSYATIDHPMSIQTGLTMRTFETLGAGLTLYTTNKQIVNEPFYDPEKIILLDNDLLNINFKKKDKNRIDENWQESFKKYRVDNWVKNILDF